MSTPDTKPSTTEQYVLIAAVIGFMAYLVSEDYGLYEITFASMGFMILLVFAVEMLKTLVRR
jgi:hypothetical protein